MNTTGSATLDHLRKVSARQQAQRANTAPTQTITVEATTPMKNFIDKLLVERQHTALTEQQIDNIKKDKAQSHRFINFLLGLPKAEAQPVVQAPVRQARLDFNSIPDGNYALDEGDDLIKFYRVSTDKKTGFKNVQARGSDALYPLKLRNGIAVMHRLVQAGLEASQMLFAHKLERCWMCGKSLTDKTSRDLGIGPDCRTK